MAKAKSQAQSQQSGKPAQQQAKQNGAAIKKTVCPVTADEFCEGARPVTIRIDGQVLEGTVKVFSSGSFGWNMNGKVTVEVNGVPVKCQVTGNIVAIGSKPEDNQ